jgi:hypothetical protein
MPGLTRWSSPLAPILLAFTCGCSEPTPSDDIVGGWIAATRDLDPTGYDQSRLSFSPSGKFSWVVNTYGLYPGQARDELTDYTRIEGRYEVSNGRLVMTTERSVTWDRFYGAHSPEVVEDPYVITLFDQARYSIGGNRLTLDYLSYPADAPVSTRQEFVRAAPTK